MVTLSIGPASIRKRGASLKAKWTANMVTLGFHRAIPARYSGVRFSSPRMPGRCAMWIVETTAFVAV